MDKMYDNLSTLKRIYIKMIQKQTQCHTMLLDFDLLQNCTALSTFWLTYIEKMLALVRNIVAFGFTYDNYNYAIYLTIFLSEMLVLENELC